MAIARNSWPRDLSLYDLELQKQERQALAQFEDHRRGLETKARTHAIAAQHAAYMRGEYAAVEETKPNLLLLLT